MFLNAPNTLSSDKTESTSPKNGSTNPIRIFQLAQMIFPTTSLWPDPTVFAVTARLWSHSTGQATTS